MGRFAFDGQLHIPPQRLEETLKLGIKQGLDAVIFTPYEGTESFDCLTSNKYEQRTVLKELEAEQLDEKTLRIKSDVGKIYVIKGQEVKTKEGHLLVWGCKDKLKPGKNILTTIEEVHNQGAIPIFSHLYGSLFHGCGEEVFINTFERFKDCPLGVEVNGQVSKSWNKILGTNRKVEELANRFNIPCFGTSDIHGRYLNEHKKIGLRCYSSVPSELVNEDIIESLKSIMTNSHQKIRIEGNFNSFYETIAWNIASVRQNGMMKVCDLIDGMKH